MTKLVKILFVTFALSQIIYPQNIDTLKLNLVSKSLPFGLTIKKPKPKPKVGLVLSGGGARAVSQIGVLKALSESNIEPDEIVGTSMGSIIGGLYSAGYCVNELDSIMRATNWNDFFTFQKTNRNDLFLEQKITEDRAILTLTLDGFKPIIPTSINTGQEVSNFLNIITLNAPLHVKRNFSELLYDFKAVSTNLINGEEYVLDKGSLSLAMRASSSVSFLLPPVSYDSLLLVDGGLVANIPIDVAKKNNCNCIIAVNTTSPLKNKNDLKYPWNIADQVVSIPIQIISKQQIKNSDILIEPKLGNKKNTDFTGLDSLVNIGYKTTLKLIPQIKAELRKRYFSNIKTDDKIYSDLTLSNNPTEIEKAVYNSLSSTKNVSKKEIIYRLYKQFESGNYKNLYSEVFSENGKSILKIYDKENPIVRNTVITGIQSINKSKVQSIVNSLLHKPYNSKKLLTALIKILRLYRKEGFALAKIDSVNFNSTAQTLQIKISEGRINKIKIEGNTKTNINVILRELPFNEGDYLKTGKISEGLKNLTSTNLFKTIDININNRNELSIKVKEKLSTVLRLGLRIDNEYFTQASFDLRDENLWGTGSELGLIFSGGLRNRLISLEHLSHRVFNTYLTYKIKAYYSFNDVNVYKNEKTDSDREFSRSKIGEYRQIFYGTTIGVGAQLKKIGNILIEGKFQRDKLKNKINYTGFSPYNLDIASLKFKLSFDSQNDYPYPTKGILLNTYYETAQKILGGDVGFTKFYFNYKNYFSFNLRNTIRLGFELGFADKTLPLSEQFSLGGQDNFFGYRDYEYRGRQVFDLSFEYRYFLPVKLFFDAYLKFHYNLGSIWAEQEQIRFKDLRHGLGASISFDTPIGPADFSIGKSFIIKNTLPKNIISWGPLFFYFTIGFYY